MGIEVQRDGTLTFDRSTFLEEYEKDPAGLQALLGADGVGGRLESLTAAAKTQVDAGIKARNDQLPRLNTSASPAGTTDWRYASRRCVDSSRPWRRRSASSRRRASGWPASSPGLPTYNGDH